MWNLTTSNLKYLFYLDILGFKNLVKEKRPEEVYKTIDKCLEIYYSWEKLNGIFSTLYFSDTIIFYQTCEEYIETAFLDIYGMAGLIFTKLLSQGIPVRGAITFGEFNTKYDSKDRNNIFFGEALVEAYELEKEEWIGIKISPSAYKNIDNNIIESFIKENVFEMRQDGCLLLNPFCQIRHWCYYENAYEEAGEMLLDDLKAFNFLINCANELNLKDPSGRVTMKYLNTVNFLKKVMKNGMFEWDEKMVVELRDKM